MGTISLLSGEKSAPPVSPAVLKGSDSSRAPSVPTSLQGRVTSGGYTGYLPATVGKVSDRAGAVLRAPQSLARSYFEDPSGQDWFSGPACSDWVYFATDPPGLLRNNISFSRDVSKIPTPAACQALGLMSGLLAVSGIASVNRGASMYKTAKKVDSLSGRIAGIATGIRGGIEAIGGVMAVPFRIFQLLPTATQASAKVSAAAQAIGLIATLAFSLLYLLIMLPVAIQTGRSIKLEAKLRAQLQKHTDDPYQQLRVLKDQIRLIPSDLDEIETKIFGKKGDDDRGSNGISKEQLAALNVPSDALDMIEKEPLRKEIYRRVAGRTPDYSWDGLSKLWNLFALEMVKTVSRKRLEVGSMMGPDVFKWLTEETQSKELETRLQKGDSKALLECQSQLEKVQRSMNHTLLLNVGIIVVSIVTSAALLVLQFAGVGAQIIAQGILGVIALLGMVIDTYFLKQALDSGYRAKFKQRVVMTLMTLMMLAVLVTSAVFAQGALQYAILAIGGVTTIGANAYVHYKWNPWVSSKKEDQLVDESAEKIAENKRLELIRFLKA